MITMKVKGLSPRQLRPARRRDGYGDGTPGTCVSAGRYHGTDDGLGDLSNDPIPDALIKPGIETRPAPAAVPSKSVRTKLGAVAGSYVVTAVILVAAVLIRTGEAAEPVVPPELDVEITACSATGPPPGAAEVLYEVTNSGPHDRAAVLHVEFRDGSGRLVGTNASRIADVGPGTTVASGTSTSLHNLPEAIRCRVGLDG